jgi:hypothetical protein
MSQTDKPSPKAARAPNHARRDLLLAAIAFVVVVGLSLGALSLFSQRPVLRDTLNEANLPKGEQPIDLAIIHTNDTWGYLSGCG